MYPPRSTSSSDEKMDYSEEDIQVGRRLSTFITAGGVVMNDNVEEAQPASFRSANRPARRRTILQFPVPVSLSSKQCRPDTRYASQDLVWDYRFKTLSHVPGLGGLGEHSLSDALKDTGIASWCRTLMDSDKCISTAMSLRERLDEPRTVRRCPVDAIGRLAGSGAGMVLSPARWVSSSTETGEGR